MALLIGGSHLLVHSILVDASLELEQSGLNESVVGVLVLLLFDGLVTWEQRHLLPLLEMLVIILILLLIRQVHLNLAAVIQFERLDMHKLGASVLG